MKALKAIILLFLSLPVSIFSQNLDSAMKYFDEARYDKAVEEFEKILPLLEKIYSKNDTSYYTFYLIYAAYSNEKCNRFEKAKNYYLNIRNIYRNYKDTLSNIYVTATNNLAELYRNTGNYTAAESLFSEILILNKTLFGEESLPYMNTLNSMGMLCGETGKYNDSESFYTRAPGKIIRT